MERQALNKKAYILSVLKQNPGEILEMLESALTTFKYRYVRRCIGNGTVVRSKTRIINTANVEIGDNCFLQDSVYIRAGAHGRVVFREGCLINSFSRFFGHGGIEVGEHTQVGPGVTITTTDHDYGKADLPEVFKKVTIGRRAWIGANVTILPGVTVGDSTVIGAGSVVTKDIPPNSVAVGVPARVIRESRPGETEQPSELAKDVVAAR